MKPNIYSILQDAINDGINAGYVRAHKHTDTPPEGTIQAEIELAIWLSGTELMSILRLENQIEN